MPLEDYLTARDATHKEDKGDRANKLEIYYDYSVGGFWKKRKGIVGVSPKKNNEDKIRKH